MFRENNQHQQTYLLSTLYELPPKVREMLGQSWAGTFRYEVFARVDEKVFGVLYSDENSRPNVPVNVQLGLEVLKSGFGWSDEQMYQSFMFDLQVRYAVGYENLGDGYFAIRTVYHFRERLSQHMVMTGENLIGKAFTQVTDEQTDPRLLTRAMRPFLNEVRTQIRRQGRADSTEKTYVNWIRRYTLFQEYQNGALLSHLHRQDYTPAAANAAPTISCASA